jgi:hypothetical protein
MIDGTSERIIGARGRKQMGVDLTSGEAANVSGRINSSAPRVMITSTVKPRSMSARASSAALYAAMLRQRPARRS